MVNVARLNDALVWTHSYLDKTFQVSWKGMLPQLTAHDREFASEEGGYDRLDETLTLTGCFCRADWVEGISGRCRTKTEGGLPRTDGWTPQGCILCNTLEASPCRDIYKRWGPVVGFGC